MDEASRQLGKMLRDTPFHGAAFKKALSKSPFSKKETIDYKSSQVDTLLVRAGYLENREAMKILIAHGADIEQIVHESRQHDLIVVLLSAGKFEAAAFLYSQLHPERLRCRDGGLDRRAKEVGKRLIKVRDYEEAVWAKKQPDLLKRLKEAQSFTWKDFLGVVTAVGVYL